MFWTKCEMKKIVFQYAFLSGGLNKSGIHFLHVKLIGLLLPYVTMGHKHAVIEHPDEACIRGITSNLTKAEVFGETPKMHPWRGKKSVSYRMVCAYVREDNPRTLASGLSPVHMHNHTITALLYQHA